MVAAATATVGESRRLSAPEEYFCRLVALDGRKPTAAYRIAWKCRTESAHDLAPRVMARPWVAARIEKLTAQANSDAMLARDERRRLLAETARSVPKGEKPTHADRVRAIHLDARLTGDLRDEGQGAGALTINFVSMVGAIAGGSPVVPNAAIPVAAERVSEPAAVPALTAPIVAPEAKETAPVPVLVASSPLVGDMWAGDE